MHLQNKMEVKEFASVIKTENIDLAEEIVDLVENEDDHENENPEEKDPGGVDSDVEDLEGEDPEEEEHKGDEEGDDEEEIDEEEVVAEYDDEEADEQIQEEPNSLKSSSADMLTELEDMRYRIAKRKRKSKHLKAKWKQLRIDHLRLELDAGKQLIKEVEAARQRKIDCERELKITFTRITKLTEQLAQERYQRKTAK